MSKMPSLFISHGAPNFILSDSPARRFLSDLPASLPAQPTAIVMISAHWATPETKVTSVTVNSTIHDFGGFEEELYQLLYNAPGAPDIARQIQQSMQDNGISCDIDRQRGLDHGAWIPLMLSWPDADIPVVQVSMQLGKGPQYHLKLGQALKFLRKQGVLIIGSGSLTHDLRSWAASRHTLGGDEPDWVKGFGDWISQKIEAGDTADLLNYRAIAPHAVRNHPTEEHFLPLFVAMGAGGGEKWRSLHQSITHSVLRMDVFAFG